MKYLQVVVFIIAVLPLMISGQAFDRPESAVYDATLDRYLISNTGNGDILSSTLEGTLTFFNNTDSESIRGITIYGDNLFAAGDEGVLVFDLATGTNILTIPIPGATFLNDITADGDGNLYVSDGSKVYKVDPVGETYEVFLENLNGSNGLMYVPDPEMMLITLETAGSTAVIASVDLTTKVIEEIVSTDFEFLDGLAMDDFWNVYVSSWSTNAVYKYDSDFANAPTIVYQADDIGPADIYFDSVNHTLVVPQMSTNSMTYIDLPYVGLLTPNGGEAWEAGSTQAITWESQMIETVDIDYSTDGGVTFELLVQGEDAALGTYSWNLPTGTSSSCIIKIFDSSDPTVMDISDDAFTIMQTVAIYDDPLPSDYALNQNYPNPFNPSTTIRYIVEESINVKIELYDLLGNLISTLLDKKCSKGIHNLNFEAGELPSGIYYYTMSAGNFSDTKKMLLIK
ncbi:MAG: T9SS type A sorting domain-containing protein [Bacteroidetes bacterium]|nr:T9SS type A sorting domain-containing protein [Bacteroidota bacterium]